MREQLSPPSDSDYIALILADGWFATYDVDGKIEKCRLIAWALQRDGHVAGLDIDSTGIADDASKTENFAGYVHEKDGQP